MRNVILRTWRGDSAKYSVLGKAELYIGKKDIKGNPIYEGDLMQTDTNIQEVVYNQSLCRFGLRQKTGATIDISDRDYVVGNIHEKEKG